MRYNSEAEPGRGHARQFWLVTSVDSTCLIAAKWSTLCNQLQRKRNVRGKVTHRSLSGGKKNLMCKTFTGNTMQGLLLTVTAQSGVCSNKKQKQYFYSLQRILFPTKKLYFSLQRMFINTVKQAKPLKI